MLVATPSRSETAYDWDDVYQQAAGESLDLRFAPRSVAEFGLKQSDDFRGLFKID